MNAIVLVFLLSVQLIWAELIFSEEFDKLDFKLWKPLITGWRGGNNEFQYYTNRSENLFVRNGKLFIKPTLTSDRFGETFLFNGSLNLSDEGCNFNLDNGCTIKAGRDIVNPIQSARIRTEGTFSFTYGIVEVRAKMPRGDWLWPAIWMLPTDSTYGGWPASGEIDMVEVRGNENLTCHGNHEGNRVMSSALHWGPDAGRNAFRRTVWRRMADEGSYSACFHVYKMKWLPSGIEFWVDDDKIGGVAAPSGGFWNFGQFRGDNIWATGTPMAPFDQRFHFVLNVAAGGNFFADNCVNWPHPKPWNASSSSPMRSFWEHVTEWYPTWTQKPDDSAMQVDYIRVYSASGADRFGPFDRTVLLIELVFVLVHFSPSVIGF